MKRRRSLIRAGDTLIFAICHPYVVIETDELMFPTYIQIEVLNTSNISKNYNYA
jgi:hypothetical protein